MRRPEASTRLPKVARQCLAPRILCAGRARRVCNSPGVTSPAAPYMRVAQSTETANQVSAGKVIALPNTTRALVAQLDRAPDFEFGGRGFEFPPSAPLQKGPFRTHRCLLSRKAGIPGISPRPAEAIGAPARSGERISQFERREFSEIAVIGVQGADAMLEQDRCDVRSREQIAANGRLARHVFVGTHVSQPDDRGDVPKRSLSVISTRGFIGREVQRNDGRERAERRLASSSETIAPIDRPSLWWIALTSFRIGSSMSSVVRMMRDC